MIISQLRAQAGGGDPSPGMALDAQGEPNRRGLHAVLDLAQPALAGRLEAKGLRHLSEREAQPGAVICECLSVGHSAECSDDPNILARPNIRFSITDRSESHSHDANMATRGDWYLQDWFASLGMIQRDLVTKLDYPPATANALWHGVQRYRRDHIADVSALLNIEPWELLMHPEEAMALRRLRSAIAEVAAPASSVGSPAPVPQTPEPRRRAS